MSREYQTSLSALKKAAYAAPAFSLAVVGIPVYVYIPKFYSDVVGVSLSLMGTVLLVVRIFDALTDPAIGLISDRTNSRFGRRRPYIIAGSLLTSLSIIMLFNPPQMAAHTAIYWFSAFMFLLFLFWTVVIVPYESLGPELTFDYDERTSLFAVRDGALIAGTLLAASSPALIRYIFSIEPGNDGERELFSILSYTYTPFIIAAALWCTMTFRERVYTGTAKISGTVDKFTSALKNRPFRILLISYTISAIGNNLPATLILYYVQYVLHSQLADVFLLIYFVTGVAFLPLWVKASSRFGKKRTWLTSMAINTAAFSGVYFLGQGDEMLYGILVFLSGTGFGAALAIPSAIQADVIDYDELISGQRREGLYIGLWSVAKKTAAALGVGAGLTLLGTAGYQPNVQQSDSVVFALRVLYSLVPCICNGLAFIIALSFPITMGLQVQIRQAIESSSGGMDVPDPLEPENIIKAGHCRGILLPDGTCENID